MTALNATAKAALKEAGISQAAWARANYCPDGIWRGDACGCFDNRCANGYHHVGEDDCGCLPVLIESYQRWLRGEDAGSFDETAPEYVNRVIVDDDRRAPAFVPTVTDREAISTVLRGYAGQFVALYGKDVIASALDFTELQAVLADKGLTADVVMRVPGTSDGCG
jgi:hypothetical protein